MPVDSKKKSKPRKKYKQYEPIFLVHIYRYAKSGLSDEAIARALEINRNTIKLWKVKRPEVREALKIAREEVPSTDTYVRYFYDRLDPKSQELWEQLENTYHFGGGYADIERILADHGRQARQSLFLYALVHTHYSPTRAMEKVGLDKRELDKWMTEDPQFAMLFQEVRWHKGNFFEESLMRLVEKGDEKAILFVNRTFNRDRGYGQTTDVNVSGQIDHQHSYDPRIDLGDLDLDLETRQKVMDAMRRKEEKDALARRLGAMRPEERAMLQIEAEIREKAEV